MFWIKKLWKNEKIRLIFISLVLSFIPLILRSTTGIAAIVSDILFTMGAVHLIVGCSRYISNVGLYKTFSYMRYKRRWKRTGYQQGETRPMSLAEYTMNVIYDEDRQRPVAWPILFGIGCWVMSVFFAFIGG